MGKYDKVYQRLRKIYTDEEIAYSMMIRQELTEAEMKKANEELRAFRFKLRDEMTAEQKAYSNRLRLRYQAENHLDEGDLY